MSDFDNTNRGVLFKNDKKGNNNAPDYKGKINVDGVDKELAAWLKVSKNGSKYMSLSVQDPYQAQQVVQPVEQAPLDEGIPF